MKRFFYFIATGTMVAVLSTSCGSSKSAMEKAQFEEWKRKQIEHQREEERQKDLRQNAESSIGVEIAKSQAQLYAEDPNATTMRAWSSYNGFPDDDLEFIAAQQARGELSNMISSMATSAFSSFADRLRKEGLIDGNLQKKISQDGKTTNKITVVAENLIKGSKVAVSNRYAQKDDTQTAYVCVEIDPAIVIEKIRNEKSIEEIFSEKEQLLNAFKSKKFEEEMQSSFERYKEEKAK